MRTTYKKLIGKEIVTDNGIYIGYVEDIDINPRTGQITALLAKPFEENSSGFLFKKKKTKKSILLEKIPRTKDKLMIISADSIKSVQEAIVIDTYKFSKYLQR